MLHTDQKSAASALREFATTTAANYLQNVRSLRAERRGFGKVAGFAPYDLNGLRRAQTYMENSEEFCLVLAAPAKDGAATSLGPTETLSFLGHQAGVFDMLARTFGSGLKTSPARVTADLHCESVIPAAMQLARWLECLEVVIDEELVRGYYAADRSTCQRIGEVLEIGFNRFLADLEQLAPHLHHRDSLNQWLSGIDFRFCPMCIGYPKRTARTHNGVAVPEHIFDRMIK